MLRLITVSCLLAFALPAVAQAQTSEYGRNNVAVGGGLAFAGEDFDSNPFNFDNTGAGNVAVEWRFHPHLAVEGRFEHTFNFDAHVPGNTDLRATVWSLTANGRVYILDGRFQPFFQLGIGVGQGEVDFKSSSDTTTNAMGRVGLGLESYVNRNVSIGAEFAYDFGFGNLDDFNYYTFGAEVKYHF